VVVRGSHRSYGNDEGVSRKRATRNREAVRSHARDDDDVKTTATKPSVRETEKAEAAKPNAEVEELVDRQPLPGRGQTRARDGTGDREGGEYRPHNRDSTIASAFVGDGKKVETTDASTKLVPASSTSTSCTRYFPTVGRTLQVPCE